jgi:hypothetical protein
MRAGWRTCYRWGILPHGYIYPKPQRAVRDLLRKRGQMVRERTANLLSIQNLFSRNTARSMNANRIKALDSQQVTRSSPTRIWPWPSKPT